MTAVGPSEQTYTVIWAINIFEADTPEDAARQALEIHRDPKSHATVFDVIDPDGRTHRVDLLDANTED